MANIPANKTEVVVVGYNRIYCNGYISSDTIQCQMLFVNDEGIPQDVEMETGNNAPIAKQYKITYHAHWQFHELIGIVPPQYWDIDNAIPRRREFLIQTKNEHNNVSKGILIKVYNYVCNIRANQESIESTKNDEKDIYGVYQYIASNKKT